MSQAVLAQLFKQCERVTPYLKGELGRSTKEMISTQGSNLVQIKSLYRGLQTNSPEAEKVYWLTRSWDLLTWQPLYLAFTAIYSMKSLPNLSHMAQHQKHGLIAGFRLNEAECTRGDYACLIHKAGQQLSQMFEHYRVELDLWLRCRPGFVQHLVADAILAKLLEVQKQHSEMTDSLVLHHAKLWLSAFNISNKHLASLYLSKLDNKLKLSRTSCCSVYKTKSGTVCDNCPRLRQKKRCIN